MNFVTDFVWEFITLFSEMAPFLLLGFLLAGILHVWVPNHLYVPKIAKSNFASVLWAAIFGVPLPICSCGVIPTSIAIRKEGASKGASVSFLISTPATGVDSILATYSLLGLPFAILRPVAAFVTALFGGVLTNFATRGEPAENVAAVHGGSAVKHEHHDHEHHHDHDDCDDDHCECGDHHHDHEHCGCCCDDDHEHCECGGPSAGSGTFTGKIKETFRYGLVNMVGDVSKWLMIGLVLLMAGPATSIASMLVVGKAFGKRTLAAYLFSIAFGAMFFGFIVDTFFMDTFLSAMLPQGAADCHGHEALGVFDYVCAGLLAAFMLYAKFAHKGCDGHCGCGCGCGDSCKCADSCEDDHCECDDDHDHCGCGESCG